MIRTSFIRHLRPVHAALALLCCTAVAIPLLTNLTAEAGSGVVEAEPGFVAPERPIDRMLSGTALGSHRISPARTAFTAQPAPPEAIRPRMVQPDRLPLAIPDAAPDMRSVQLSLAAAQPPRPASTPAPSPAPERTAAVQDDPDTGIWMPAPRRKPRSPLRSVSISETALPTLSDPDPAVATLPEIIAVPVPVVATRPAIPSTGVSPRIALIITAAGLHTATTERAIEGLPGGVTLAFAPIGTQTAPLAEAAIKDGHTVLVEIPMEPINQSRDPGEPLTLRVSNSGTANIARLDKALSRFPGASGISSYLGARFSRSEQAASPVVKEIASRGLFLFENQPNSQSRLGPLARSHNAAYASGSLVIDSDQDQTRIADRLAMLERQARRDGVAIGVASAYRESITAIERWVVAAEKRGIVFVPVTKIETAG